jgi:hypothetical protein
MINLLSLQHRYATGLVLWSILGLTACDRQKPPVESAESSPAPTHQPASSKPLVVLSKTLTETQPNCQDNCAKAIAKTLYVAAPDEWLNATLNKAMLDLADAGISETPAKGQTVAQRLKDFVQPVAAEAQDPSFPAYDMTLAADVVREHGSLVVIGLSGAYFTGGAHGSAVQRYVVADRQAHRILTLKDLILPNQDTALSTLFHTQFSDWVKQDDPNTNVAEYEQAWPFHLAEQWWLSDDGLVMAYGQYEIGPYVVGMPELVVPYAQLKGMLKPQYFPTPSAVSR